MRFSQRHMGSRWIILLICVIVVSMILWNTYTFFQIFKNEERLKMNLWANAQKTLINADENTDVDLPLQIFSTNTSIPVILTMYGEIVSTVNISDHIISDPIKATSFLEQLKRENDPIVIHYAPGKTQNLYYGDSELLNKLKYYPIALLLIIFLFILVIFNLYRSTKIATENKLWAGMAKETAHQIGTPLSSLIGWIEILKTENIDQSITEEISKDIDRLQTITDRFSKIGSAPLLSSHDIVSETLEIYDYLQSRFSSQIKFTTTFPSNPIKVSINPTLHSWTIENLVKNAIDAMRGKGHLDLKITEDETYVYIIIKDSGNGIAKNQYKTIFEPGFTTKKRGWGLGLSLTKRIVNTYHKGHIKVLHSELGHGTSFQITLKKNV